MFREELTKILTNKVFYLAIAAVVVLLLLGNIYTSPETGEEYTVIGLALDDEKEEVIGIGDLHARDIMITGVPGYLEMFIPIIVAIPFIIPPAKPLPKDSAFHRMTTCRHRFRQLILYLHQNTIFLMHS